MDKLVIEPEKTEDDGIIEFTTREEYINCACICLQTIGEVDAMTAASKQRMNRIKRKCLRIIDDMVKEMYDELFETETDEEED